MNEEWISDKTRFACDGLRRQRLDRPYLRRDGRLVPAGWQEAFEAVAERLRSTAGGKIAAIVGDQCDAESMFALKQLMTALGTPHLECRQDGARLDATARAGYLFNSTIAGIENADAMLLVGTNPRREAPVLNARVRKRWLAGGLEIGLVGQECDLTYPYRYLGDTPELLARILEGGHEFARALRSAQAPMLVLGMAALARDDGAAVHALAREIADAFGMVREGWNGFNVLHTAASRVGALDLGFVPGEGGRDLSGIVEGVADGSIDLLWLLGADEIADELAGDAFVVYQGPPRRPGRPPGRRHPSGRRLHREGRTVCQHRGPGAGRGPGRLPARAGA